MATFLTCSRSSWETDVCVVKVLIRPVRTKAQMQYSHFSHSKYSAKLCVREGRCKTNQACCVDPGFVQPCWMCFAALQQPFEAIRLDFQKVFHPIAQSLATYQGGQPRSDYWEMPLHKLRCKWDRMPKSIVQILFNSGCEVEREKSRKEEWRERGKEKVTTHGPSGLLLVLLHLGLLGGGRDCSILFIICTFLQTKELMLLGYKVLLFYWVKWFHCL